MQNNLKSKLTALIFLILGANLVHADSIIIGDVILQRTTITKNIIGDSLFQKNDAVQRIGNQEICYVGTDVVTRTYTKQGIYLRSSSKKLMNQIVEEEILKKSKPMPLNPYCLVNEEQQTIFYFNTKTNFEIAEDMIL